MTEHSAFSAIIFFSLGTIAWGFASIKTRAATIHEPLAHFTVLEALSEKLYELDSSLWAFSGATISLGAGIWMFAIGMPTDKVGDAVRLYAHYVVPIYILVAPIVNYLSSRLARQRLLKSASIQLEGDWTSLDRLSEITAEEESRIRSVGWLGDARKEQIVKSLYFRTKKIVDLIESVQNFKWPIEKSYTCPDRIPGRGV